MLLYISLLTLSCLLALSANSFFNIWVAMEMSILALIPLLIKFNSSNSNESTLKYFLIQICAGLLFLGAFLNSNSMEVIMLTAILIKLGLFPFFMWVPHVFSGLPFLSLFIISTIQKFAPLVVLSNLFSFLLSPVIIFSVMVGASGGIFMMNFKKLLAYSSISHTGWLCALSKTFFSWASYLMFYMLLSFMVFYFLSKQHVKGIPQTLLMMNPLNKMTLWVLILSLAGLPPLLGFSLKWMALSTIINTLGVIVWFLVIMFALSLFFYLNMFISTTMLTTKSFSNRSPNFMKSVLIMNTMGTLLVLPLV